MDILAIDQQINDIQNGKYSFHINRKHTLHNEITKQLDDNGKAVFEAYLSLIEDFAPFVQSGLLDTIHGKNTTTTNADTLEQEIQIEEIKKYIGIFKTQGFQMEEIKSTLIEMSSYRHLKHVIVKLMEDECND